MADIMTNKQIRDQRDETLNVTESVRPSRMTSNQIRNLESMTFVDKESGKPITYNPKQYIQLCEEAISNLYTHLNYLPAPLQHIIWTFSRHCPTAYTDGRDVAFNPNFAFVLLQYSVGDTRKENKEKNDNFNKFRSLGDSLRNARYFLFVLMHEFYHQLYKHLEREDTFRASRDGKCDHELANIAQDIEINRDLAAQYPLFRNVHVRCPGQWFEDFIQKYQLQGDDEKILRYSAWEDIYIVLENHGHKVDPPKGGGDGPEPPKKPKKKIKVIYSDEAKAALEKAFHDHMEELKKLYPNGAPRGGMMYTTESYAKKNGLVPLTKALFEAATVYDEIINVTVDQAIAAGIKLAEDIFFGKKARGRGGDKVDVENAPDVPQPPIESGDESGDDGDGDGDGDDIAQGASMVVDLKEMEESIKNPHDHGGNAADIMRQIKEIAGVEDENETGYDESPKEYQDKITKVAQRKLKKGEKPEQGFGQSLGEVYDRINNLGKEGDIKNWKDRLRPFLDSHRETKTTFVRPVSKADLEGTEYEPLMHLPTKDVTVDVMGEGILDVVFIVDNSGSMQFTYRDEDGTDHSIFDKIINEIIYLEKEVHVEHSALAYFSDGTPGEPRFWDADEVELNTEQLIESLQRHNDMSGGTSLVHSLRELMKFKNDLGEPLIDEDTKLIIISDGGDNYTELEKTLRITGTPMFNCVYLLYGCEDKWLLETVKMIEEQCGMTYDHIIPINVASSYGATRV